MDSVKQRFRELIKDIDASEISKMEQALIQEGMPDEEVKKLCDVHVQVFKESLEEKDMPLVPEGHPVHTFMLENRAAENIMNKLENICKTIEDGGSDEFEKYSNNLTKLITSLRKIDIHFLRKENQLFPPKKQAVSTSQSDGQINRDTGTLSIEQINLLLKHLPVDISFVDVDDTVRYYSATEERIFPRSPAVIGRKVQNCHPPKSVHVVQEILDDFRNGKRDTAEFWIHLQKKFIHTLFCSQKQFWYVSRLFGNFTGCYRYQKP